MNGKKKSSKVLSDSSNVLIIKKSIFDMFCCFFLYQKIYVYVLVYVSDGLIDKVNQNLKLHEIGIEQGD